jgi:hypothetical protein
MPENWDTINTQFRAPYTYLGSCSEAIPVPSMGWEKNTRFRATVAAGMTTSPQNMNLMMMEQAASWLAHI